MGETFTGGADSLLSEDATASPERLSLVVLWSRSEPERAGEVLLVLPRRGGWVVGRQDTPAPGRLGLVRQRPGHNEPAGEFSARRLSRTQLQVRLDRGRLEVRNAGRLEMRVNNQATTQASLVSGDLLELDRELLLLCAPRPETLPTGGLAPHPFGLADADGIVGETPEAWALRSQIALCAASGGHVLIQGASGSGKELVAQAIHRQGPSRREIVSRNASTFPEGILDAELFGNLRDYPNPGIPARPGAIGEADRSSLFLDELGETSHAMQAHLLRVMDSGEYQRLGESRARTAQFRLIGATNRDLDTLKHDFLARFERRVHLPDLNARVADIPLLARHILGRLAADNPALFPEGPPPLHPDLIRSLVRHRYTTNAREVSRLLWASVEHWRQHGGKYLSATSALPRAAAPAPTSTPEALTREDILAAYRHFNGVQARVPAYLGLRDRFQLARLEKKLGITRADRAATQD